MEYTIKATLVKGESKFEINGQKFVKNGHRWQNEKGESAQNYREALEDLLAALQRYQKIDTRVKGWTSETPALKIEEPTVTQPIETVK